MIEYSYTLASDLNAFRRSAGWYEFSSRQLECAKKGTLFAITALDGELEAGCARIVGDGGYQFFFCDVIVKPEYQGQGIGSEMVNRLIEKALSACEKGDTVMFNLMSAKNKEPFYEKLGFMRRPNDERGSGMTKFVVK